MKRFHLQIQNTRR